MTIDAEVHEEQSSQSTKTNVPAGQSTGNAVLDEIGKMKDSFSSELKSVSKRVKGWQRLSMHSLHRKKKGGRDRHLWAALARMKRLRLKCPLPSFQHDSDVESGMEGDEGTELSESSKSLVISVFSSSLQNSERRRIRTQYPLWATADTMSKAGCHVQVSIREGRDKNGRCRTGKDSGVRP